MHREIAEDAQALAHAAAVIPEARGGAGARSVYSVCAAATERGVLEFSTRRMEKLVETLGITRLSKSQVSVMAKQLDAHVEDFRTRPLDQGPYTSWLRTR